MLKIDLGDSKALRGLQSHLCFLGGLCLMNLVGVKGQKHRTKLDISGSQLIVSWVPSTRLKSQVLMLFTSHLWRRNRGKSLGKTVVWSKGDGNHTGQDETRVISCFFALSFPWCFYSWKQVPGNRGIGGAPGTWCSWWKPVCGPSLSPEHIQPHDSSRFSLLGKAEMPHFC